MSFITLCTFPIHFTICINFQNWELELSNESLINPIFLILKTQSQKIIFEILKRVMNKRRLISVKYFIQINGP